MVHKLKMQAVLPSEAQIKEAYEAIEPYYKKCVANNILDEKIIERELINILDPLIQKVVPTGEIHIIERNERQGSAQNTQSEMNAPINESRHQGSAQSTQSEMNTPINESRHQGSTRNRFFSGENLTFTSETISDPNGENEHELFDQYLGSNYKWKERISDFGDNTISSLLENIKKSLKQRHKKKDDDTQEMSQNNEQNKTDDQILRDSLKKKLIDDYKNDAYKYRSTENFINEWVDKRKEVISDAELCFSPRYCREIIKQYLETGSYIPTQKRGGTPYKVTVDTLKCLIATILDYPDANDKERAEYINKYGPNSSPEMHISESTVNRVLNELNFTVQTPCFSPVQRNSFGYRLARVLWGNVISKVAEDTASLICFIDEASVVYGRRNRGRGFSSVRPCINKALRTSSLSILTCVIPNFGVIYRWFDKGVTNTDYSKFLRDITYVIRNNICNTTTQLVFIQDNASIHKTELVFQTGRELKINLFFTVPYSPQCNLPAENFFARLKENALYQFRALDNEIVENAPVQHMFSMAKHSVIIQWDNYVSSNYNYQDSANIYMSWLTVVSDCINGIALNGLHYEQSKAFDSKQVHSMISGIRAKN